MTELTISNETYAAITNVIVDDGSYVHPSKLSDQFKCQGDELSAKMGVPQLDTLPLPPPCAVTLFLKKSESVMT